MTFSYHPELSPEIRKTGGGGSELQIQVIWEQWNSTLLKTFSTLELLWFSKHINTNKNKLLSNKHIKLILYIRDTWLDMWIHAMVTKCRVNTLTLQFSVYPPKDVLIIQSGMEALTKPRSAVTTNDVKLYLNVYWMVSVYSLRRIVVRWCCPVITHWIVLFFFEESTVYTVHNVHSNIYQEIWSHA